jgi:hypothetical protein
LHLFYIFIDLWAGYRVGDAGYWGLDTRYSILDAGYQMINEKGTKAEGRVTNDKITIFGGKNVF